jgi:hypothetical protein
MGWVFGERHAGVWAVGCGGWASKDVDGGRGTLRMASKTVPKGEAVGVHGWSFGERSRWMRSGAHEARRSDAAPVRGEATQKGFERSRARRTMFRRMETDS